MKLQITYMGVEEDLLLEEAEEGHLEQLNRCEQRIIQKMQVQQHYLNMDGY